MKTIILASGTYAVDDVLANFEVIEKPSSNVAFVATYIATRQLYVQFKNGSGYMYSDVDLDTLSFIPAAESIGKFISSQVVKKFPSVKVDKTLITIYREPLYTKEDYENHTKNVDMISASMKAHGKSIFDDIDDPTF